MKGDKYVINGVGFQTKKDVVEHVRRILRRAEVDSRLGPAEFGFMRDLFTRHQHAHQKIGCGVRFIRVRTSPWKNQRMFEIEREDGTLTDISYLSCIYPTSPYGDFVRACRESVVEDVLMFKAAYFEVHADEQNEIRCPVTGEMVGWYDVHVDHKPPETFQRIVCDFIDAYGVEFESVAITGIGDGEVLRRFEDDDWKQRFRKFHNGRAKLRCIERLANLQRQQ